jgi:hypothetical protein
MAKYTGKGSTFEIRTVVSPETFITVAQVREIGGADITSEEIDFTTLDDNQSGAPTDYKDFGAGFKDPGEMPITLMFDPNLASHVTDPKSLHALFESGEAVLVRIKIGNVSPAKYIRANGFIRDWTTPTLNATDPVESTFVLRLKQRPVMSTT